MDPVAQIIESHFLFSSDDLLFNFFSGGHIRPRQTVQSRQRCDIFLLIVFLCWLLFTGTLLTLLNSF